MITILSFRDLVRLFFIFQKEFKWAFLTTIIIAVLGAFLLPARYDSEARLLIKPGRENSTVPIELSDRQTFAAPSSQRDQTADEEKALTSQPIVHKVAEYYLNEVNNAPPPKSLWKKFKREIGKIVGDAIESVRQVFESIGVVEPQTPVERLATKLEKNFSVSHATGSAVMEITFSWDDPAIAQRIVESWIKIYQEERLKVLANTGLYNFYEAEGKKTNQLIDQYKSEIAKLQNGSDSIDIQQRIASLTKRIDTLRSQSFDTNAELNSLKQGVNNASGQVNELPKEVTTEREFSLNPTQLDLKNRLNELQLKRINDLRTYVETAPQIKALDDSIAQIQQQIANEPTKVQRLENQAPNVLVTNLRQNLMQKQVRISELTALAADQQRQMTKLSTELREAQAIEPDITRLQRQLALVEKNAALYSESLEKSRIDSALDKNRISNIITIEQPTYKPGKAFPKTIPILLAAIPGGLFVGMFVLYVCFLLDLRIHDGGRIEKVFRIPLWASLQQLGSSAGPESTTAFKVNLYQICNLLPLHQVAERGITLALASSHHGAGVSFIAQHLAQVLNERGYQVRIDNNQSVAQLTQTLNERGLPLRPNHSMAAAPGQIVILDCAAMLTDQSSFLRLSMADLIVLVVEARKTSIPTVRNAVELLTTAFKKVDGIIINRRQFEIPESLLRRFSRWTGVSS